jgi:hypothetical protein
MKKIAVAIAILVSVILGTVMERSSLFGRACTRYGGVSNEMFSCLFQGKENKNSIIVVSQFCDDSSSYKVIVSSDERRYTLYCE